MFRPLTVRSLSRRACFLATTVALTGCQSVTGSSNLSQVRVIDASPDAGGLDVYQGTGILAYNLGLGTVTSYVPITPGEYTIHLDRAGTHQQVISAGGTFQANSQYTVLVGNYSNVLQEVILKDQAQAAPTGQVSLRFIDESTRAGAVDLYLVPAGSTIVQVRPTLAGVTFGQNSGYLTVSAGTYTLIALPAGTVPTTSTATSYTGSAVNYSSGAAKTVVLLDQQLVTTPGLQVVLASDYDPAGATS